MMWLRDHGIIANYADYRALPLGLLEDCRLLMDADETRARLERAKHGNGG